MNIFFCCYKPQENIHNCNNIDSFYSISSKEENQQFINNIELPKEWIEKCSLSGETYWYNIETHKRTYKEPKRIVRKN